jgi:Flp pilus assembly protein TadD
MRIELRHALFLLVFGLALASCSTPNKLFDLAHPNSPGNDASASTKPDQPGTDSTASADKGLLGSEAYDDLSLGKKQYRAKNFGLAENYFRHAVEMHPRDAEAWLGLAASCDRLRRFDLADRAYAQAIRIVGPVPEILNNQGYSYMLRGDYKRARETLKAAQRKDPDNKFVQSNLRLLDESARTGKAIE